MGIFGMVMIVVFWVAIIVLAVWGIKRFTQEIASTTSKGVLDITKERYIYSIDFSHNLM